MSPLLRLAGPKDLLLHLLWPQVCAACADDLPAVSCGPLCGSCITRLQRMAPDACGFCGKPRALPGAGGCRECGDKPLALGGVRAAFLYKDPVRALIHRFKYDGRRSLAKTLGDWLASAALGVPQAAGCDLIVPVPLHRRRLRERGFNQAELLAERVAAALGRPAARLLTRGADTAAQWRLSAEKRRGNVANAFQATALAPGARVLLIDDVCTTGATLEACAQALKATGAAHVFGLVVARD